MAWVIAVLGAALAVGGGVSLWTGSGYIRLDWGQAQTVAGTVALSAGVVTVAIAAVLFAIRDALRQMGRAAGRDDRGMARRPASVAASDPGFATSGVGLEASGVGLEAVHLDEEPEAAGAPVGARGRIAGRLARVGLPKADPADHPAAEPAIAPAPPAAPVAFPGTETARPERHLAEPAPEPLYDPRPRAAPVAVPEALRPAAPTVAEAPTVVGRYEANGASYVLFSDGTIEVETEGGTHRFASMADLKDHIERQDAR